FQPSYVITTGPAVTAVLLGNTSGISLSLRTVSPSNTTQTALRVHLRLNQSLHLCGDNDTNTDCCLKPLCILEALQVSACVNGTPQASLLIQAKIHANKTLIPNQVYQPLGACPCDLTFRACDVRCCCDKDCSSEDLKLFVSHCLLGPFGGQVSPVPDYQCSVQSSENSPDWFPFLCVSSPPENNPYLGLFYQGGTAPKPGPSFQSPVMSAPVPVNVYIQGGPIFTLSDQYFTIPQKALGLCVNNAPVAFLKNFKFECATLLLSCPSGYPLQTLPAHLSVKVKNGQGENLTLALDYKFYWKENGITGITLTRTVGTVVLNGRTLTTRYSAMFLNGEFMGEPNSYQVGKPVIAGIMETLDNSTGLIQRASVNVWKPSAGLCSTAGKKPVLFGENSTTGCLLPVSQQNLTQCNLLETVTNLQADLIAATYVAKSGNPDFLTVTDWKNISVTLNSSTAMENSTSTCYDIPAHQHIHVWSVITSVIEGVPQREIHALQVWTLDCGGGAVSSCVDPKETQLFSVTSSVTFIDIPINTGPPKTFHINFTEYDCNRNDVCWPELAFPITKYYTESHSQSLAKGMILVFFFIVASVLGTPWRQIRQ
uniref:Tectonic family member 2 n=1 Tax=Amphilophus citrinellus TaxID=61819 RepID=A0A3Q0RXH3_AMPCI